MINLSKIKSWMQKEYWDESRLSNKISKVWANLSTFTEKLYMKKNHKSSQSQWSLCHRLPFVFLSLLKRSGVSLCTHWQNTSRIGWFNGEEEGNSVFQRQDWVTSTEERQRGEKNKSFLTTEDHRHHEKWRRGETVGLVINRNRKQNWHNRWETTKVWGTGSRSIVRRKEEDRKEGWTSRRSDCALQCLWIADKPLPSRERAPYSWYFDFATHRCSAAAPFHIAVLGLPCCNVVMQKTLSINRQRKKHVHVWQGLQRRKEHK